MFTCYAVDDEPSALEILKDYLSFTPSISLLKTFNNPLTALDYISKNDLVDLIFLDIEMPNLNGIELAKLISHKAKKIVFTTAHNKYAYDSIELEMGYLLKPYTFAKFNKLIEKTFELNNKEEKIDSILVKQAGDRSKKYNIKFKDVLFFESQLRHTKIKTLKETILCDSSLSKIKTLITTQKNFVQIHRSYIISVDFIKIIGHGNIILENNIRIPVGRNYRNQFLKTIVKLS